MPSTVPSAGATRLVASSIVARLPLTMLPIGLLVHTQRLTGSFAAAGVVTGVYGMALGIGAPWLGRIVDRRGPTLVLLASAVAGAVLLMVIAVQPAGSPIAVLIALAGAIGLATPPVGACLRTQLPALLPDPGTVRRGYALEASVVELTWIVGPPLALCIGAAWSTAATLAVSGVVMVTATAAYAAQPASRRRPPAPAARPRHESAMRAPAIQTMAIVLVAVGVLLGAVEVGITAAAKTLDSTTAASPLLALWGGGSFAGGMLAARRGGGVRTAGGLALLLGALTAGHLALIAVAGSLPAIGVVLLIAGAAIAPAEASLYAMADDLGSTGSMTEAFASLAMAVEVGGAAGAALAGMLTDRGGPEAAFALAALAGALAVATTIVRANMLRSPPAPALGDAGTTPGPAASRFSVASGTASSLTP